MNRLTSLFTIAACGVGALSAQPRRADITGGGGDRGKCTIEVVVDGAAEVEVRGDTANLRNLAGQPPQWRRFVCNGPMPPNPRDFRFAGVDGRGRQTLVRDPRQGGAAVVRIEDPGGGQEGYTFDLFWGAGGGGYGGPQTPPLAPAPPPQGGRFEHDDERYYRDREDWFRGDWRARFFERVREDIDHAERFSFQGGADRYRLDRTRQELGDLQREWAQYHRVNRRDIDDVVNALGRVLRDNRLSRRDAEILENDMNRLREFRDRR